jgi:signal transduction histidine kinase
MPPFNSPEQKAVTATAADDIWTPEQMGKFLDHVAAGLGRYPAPIEAALYYYCTEALQNAVKHGGPDTTATITAHANDRMLTLTISDTGRGFDPATTGRGLTNMTDRLSAIGGQLLIDTAPGRGTRITATVATPVQPYESSTGHRDDRAPQLWQVRPDRAGQR